MAKKYHTEEERKAAARAKLARYLSNPENKAKVHARQAARRADPEVRAKQRAYAASRRAKPEVKANDRKVREAYDKTPAGIRTRTKSNWRFQGIKFASEFDREIWLALALHDGTVCAVTGMTNAEHQAKFGCRLSLDHDHSTGEPRRFLCGYLNTALGVFEQLALTDEQLNNFISLVKEDRR